MGDEIGVPLAHAHLAQGNAETIGDDLRVGRLVPLPRRLAPDEHGGRAFRVEAERRPLVAVGAAGIDIEGKPDAAQMRRLSCDSRVCPRAARQPLASHAVSRIAGKSPES